MECAVCKAKVNDFKLQKICLPNTEGHLKTPPPQMGSFMPEPLDSGFLDFIDRAQGSSTPVSGGKAGRSQGNSARTGDRAVLRIDNVPWVCSRLSQSLNGHSNDALQDITPPAIIAWLKQPVERVHVLLDRKGKTLSHAFVEMASADAAKAALRTSQNSVLGKGKRARGVTVTRSNQEELMRSVGISTQTHSLN